MRATGSTVVDLGHPAAVGSRFSDRVRGLGVPSYTRAMESSPDRPVQFRNDLDARYGLVGDLQTTVRGIAATQQQHGVRLVRVERGVIELRTDVTGLRSDVTEIRGGVTGLRSDVTEIRGDVTEIRGDVTGLRGDVTEVRGDVTEVRGDVVGLRTDVTELKLTVGRLGAGQDGLRGDVAELRSGQEEILRLLRARP